MASTLENNTSAINKILNTINNLPDAAGGGGSVETCTVTITCSQAMMMYADVSYTTVNSEGDVEYLRNATVRYGTQFTVACRTILLISFLDEIASYTLENASLESRSGNVFVLSIDAEQGGTVKITTVAYSGQA